MASSRTQWHVQLGDLERHGLDCKPVVPQGMTVIGSVARGLQFGALAVDSEGRYYQLNGEHVALLSTSQLRRAVDKARARGGAISRNRTKKSGLVSAPTVTVKRRRTLEIA